MNKKTISYFLVFLMMMFSISSVNVLSDEEGVLSLDVPQDFLLDAYCGGFPPWTEIYRVQIDSDGNGVYSVIYPEDRDTADFTVLDEFDLTEDNMNDLWDSIVDNDFFNLDPLYYDGSVDDGTFANLTITANEMTHSVETENIDIGQFDDIVKTVNSVTPDDYDLMYNSLINNAPLRPSPPEGHINISAGKEYVYTTSTFDFDGDQVFFLFDWGDGTFSDWLGPYDNEQVASVSHAWDKKGNYDLRVKAIDDPNGDGDYSDGYESGWSDSFPITSPKIKNQYILFVELFLDRLIDKFPFLDFLLSNSYVYKQKLDSAFEGSFANNPGTTVVPDDPGKNPPCKFKIVIKICLVGKWVDNASDGDINLLNGRIQQDFNSRWNRDQWDKDGKNGSDGEDPWSVPCKAECKEKQPGCIIHFEVVVTKLKNASDKDKKNLSKWGYHVINVPDPAPGVSTVNGLDNNNDGTTDDLPDPEEDFGSSGTTTGTWAHNAPAGVFAHELGHLLGRFDQYTESWPDKNKNGKKDPNERETKPKDGFAGNIMAETNGYPSQTDVNNIWDNQSKYKCECECCPEKNDTEEPEVDVSPVGGGTTITDPVVTFEVEATDDDSGVATLDYRLDWEGGFHEGGGTEVDPPENYVKYFLGPINLDAYIDPEDWITMTVFATDAADNIGEGSVTLTWVEDQQDTTPPSTEEIVGQPNEQDGFIIYPFTPITLHATDDMSGVNYIHYEIWWDTNEDGIVDTKVISEDVYTDNFGFSVEMFGILFGYIEIHFYAVDNAENTEIMNVSEHQVIL